MDRHGSRNQRYGITSRFRLRNYDYTTPGTYFITICTEGRVHRFGSILDDRLRFTPAGEMVSMLWDHASSQFAEITIDAWVTMPNHVHALIGIGREHPERPQASLSDVLQWYKSVTTTRYVQGVRSEGWPRFNRKLWQDGFHDHIVRDDQDLDRIREYIAANPARWNQDIFAPYSRALDA